MDNNITFVRNEKANINNTSFHDVEISASLEDLTARFGAHGTSDGYKTKHEWVFEGSDGSVITIYDYKFDGAREKHWHVGGASRASCQKFVRWYQSTK